MARLNRRDFVKAGFAAGAVFALPGQSLHAAANEEISVGFISCGGRAGGLMGSFEKIKGVNIAGLCDPDEKRLGLAKQRFPKATGYSDLRDLIADESIDAVVVATCNHWHCLAAIWAMEAGKDVYVEKPLSHSQWEGQQTVAAARKYDRICQLGTQQRSDPMQAEIKQFLHEEKGLGEIEWTRVNRIGRRASIGKRNSPLEIEKNVKYDLWLGPAQDQPIFRNKLHYDWHWDWNTGSGEMGNWGVHVLDDVRNNVFQDSVTLPQRIQGTGGRVIWEDAGQTPNVHYVYFDTGSTPVVITLANIESKPGSKKSPSHPGPGSGYVAYCQGGRFEGQRGRGAAFDKDGKMIKQFKGNSGNGLHQQNFIDAVRAHDASILNADVEIGNDSTGWCNLANIAYRAGSPYSVKTASAGPQEFLAANKEMESVLAPHEIKLEGGQIMCSPVLDFDVKTERFIGPHSDSANQFLKREYRAPYIVPKLV